MIRLASKPPEPAILSSDKVTRAKAAIAAKVAAGLALSSENDFPNYWTEIKVRKVIWDHQHRKCCYCERIRDLKREPDVEHFRPKTETAEDGNPGYWWLAYNFKNLFFSCKACNQIKSSSFPLVSGTRARQPGDDISLEKPVLPHPIDEDPEDFIGFKWDEISSPVEEVKPYGKDETGRGNRSIKILGLDRAELISEQSRALLSLEAYVTKYYASYYLGNTDLRDQIKLDINKLTEPQNEFAGLKRSYFKARGLGEIVSNDR